MGYPNPAESDYDLFMTGHAGCSVSTRAGPEVRRRPASRPDEHRHAVAVIGDGAFPSGIVFEAMNNAGGLKKKLIVVLNDNKMSICPRVGGLADYLDRLRMTPFYTGLKSEVQKLLDQRAGGRRPGRAVPRADQGRVKAGLLGGMLFEELGFRYIGPVDGHNIRQLQKYLAMVRDFERPGAAARGDREGARLRAGRGGPGVRSTPRRRSQRENGSVVSLKKSRPARLHRRRPRRDPRRRCSATRASP